MSAASLKKLKNLKAAALEARTAETSRKNHVLLFAAKLLKDRQVELLKANEKDVISLRSKKIHRRHEGRAPTLSPALLSTGFC